MMLGWLRIAGTPAGVRSSSRRMRCVRLRRGRRAAVATAAELPGSLEPDVVILAVKPR